MVPLWVWVSFGVSPRARPVDTGTAMAVRKHLRECMCTRTGERFAVKIMNVGKEEEGEVGQSYLNGLT